MSIPVDEMLSELRAVLEQFGREPTFAHFDRIQKETRRIEGCCEDILYPDSDEQREPCPVCFKCECNGECMGD